MCALVTVHCCSPTGDQHSRTHHATTQPRWVPCDLKTQARTHAHTCTHIRVWERRTLCWSLTTWTSSLPQSSYMHACTHAHTHTHVHTQTGAGKTYTVLGPHDLDLLSATDPGTMAPEAWSSCGIVPRALADLFKVKGT